MSMSGGIYKGPGGQLLHGDGKPVGSPRYLPDPKWQNDPKDKHEAEMALIGKHCIVCGSPLLLSFTRPPIPNWKAHCNHCGTEMLIAVLINRKAWKI